MTEKNYKESYTLWQEAGVDSIPEPALLIEAYSDCIVISQDGNRIQVNYESINELCRLLKKLKP